MVVVRGGGGLGQSQKFVWIKALSSTGINRIKSWSLFQSIFQSHGSRPISSAVDARNQTQAAQNEHLNSSKHTTECATGAGDC